MALTRKIAADTGSEEVRLLREQHNALLLVVEGLLAAAQLTDFAAFKLATAAATLNVSHLRKLVASGGETPVPPHPTDA